MSIRLKSGICDRCQCRWTIPIRTKGGDTLCWDCYDKMSSLPGCSEEFKIALTMDHDTGCPDKPSDFAGGDGGDKLPEAIPCQEKGGEMMKGLTCEKKVVKRRDYSASQALSRKKEEPGVTVTVPGPGGIKAFLASVEFDTEETFGHLEEKQTMSVVRNHDGIGEATTLRGREQEQQENSGIGAASLV